MTITSKVARLYRNAFSQHGRSSASVLCPKGRHHLRFGALLSRLKPEGGSLLDFGCGLGHLCAYLDEHGIACRYLGVDIVPEFIASNRTEYPDREFRQIADVSDLAERFDIVLASGVFNLRYLDDSADNIAYVHDRILQLFAICDEALTIDFMTSHCDFQREEAFHFDPSDMLDFAITNLSRRAVIDHSYMPYEFSLTVFRNDAIDRAGSVYA